MKINNDFKRLLRWFAIFAIMGLIIANWGKICLFTDYRFLQAKIFELAQAKGLIAKAQESGPNLVKIPEIGLKAPLVSAKSAEPRDIENDLKRGVVLYPNSVLPGEKGAVVLLGHSAPNAWPKANNFYWVFSQLNNLEKGNKLSLDFNNTQYFYTVISKKILNKGEALPQFNPKEQKLVLISCWPPGKNSQRIIIEATLR